MKSFKQFITEVWHSAVPFPEHWKNSNQHFDVHKNPGKSELHKLVHNSEAKSLRGIIHGKDVYVWDAMGAYHSHVDDHLKLDSGNKNYIHIGKDRLSSEYNGDGDVKHITEHPWIKSTLDNHRFFHS